MAGFAAGLPGPAGGMTTLSAGRTGFGWGVRRAVDTASATAERSAGWMALPRAVRAAARTGGTKERATAAKWERPSVGRTELPRAAGLAVDLDSALVAKKKFPSADWRDPAKSSEWTSAKSNKIYCESSILLVPSPTMIFDWPNVISAQDSRYSFQSSNASSSGKWSNAGL